VREEEKFVTEGNFAGRKVSEGICGEGGGEMAVKRIKRSLPQSEDGIVVDDNQTIANYSLFLPPLNHGRGGTTIIWVLKNEFH
jgi:hypothetical protein